MLSILFEPLEPRRFLSGDTAAPPPAGEPDTQPVDNGDDFDCNERADCDPPVGPGHWENGSWEEIDSFSDLPTQPLGPAHETQVVRDETGAVLGTVTSHFQVLYDWEEVSNTALGDWNEKVCLSVRLQFSQSQALGVGGHLDGTVGLPATFGISIGVNVSQSNQITNGQACNADYYASTRRNPCVMLRVLPSIRGTYGT